MRDIHVGSLEQIAAWRCMECRRLQPSWLNPISVIIAEDQPTTIDPYMPSYVHRTIVICPQCQLEIGVEAEGS